jgi:hypothetical protein
MVTLDEHYINFEPTEIDFKQMTPAMLERIINKPSEASGCIQCLLETLSRRDAEIEFLSTIAEHNEDSLDLSWKLVQELMEFYILSPWCKRVWNAICGNRSSVNQTQKDR